MARVLGGLRCPVEDNALEGCRALGERVALAEPLRAIGDQLADVR